MFASGGNTDYEPQTHNFYLVRIIFYINTFFKGIVKAAGLRRKHKTIATARQQTINHPLL